MHTEVKPLRQNITQVSCALGSCDIPHVVVGKCRMEPKTQHLLNIFPYLTPVELFLKNENTTPKTGRKRT